MLTSLAIIFLAGMFSAYLFGKIKLPSLLGMLIVGIAAGPFAFDVLDKSLLLVSPDLRQLALVIILSRVGLTLDINDLKKVGRPAFLMCWLPATFEIVGVMLLAPPLLGITRLDAAIIGSVVAAVSPAVIVPRMLALMERGYGKLKSIPQLIMAGASADDIYVIVLFSSFIGMATGNGVGAARLLQIPVSVVLGGVVGAGVGLGLVAGFKHVHIRDTAKVVIFLSIAFLLISFEKASLIPFSGLVAIVCVGLVIMKRYEILAKRLSGKFSKLWVAAEILLFVLVGATVDIHYALSAGPAIIALVLGALLFRMLGVWLCLLGSTLTRGERLFCMMAYVPKATVQAAIGAIPLGMGLPCGQLVLTVAVISILITAPLGALAIDLSYPRLLVGDHTHL